MSKEIKTNGGIGFLGMLAHIITWSWWLILSPLWIPFVAVIFTVIMMLAMK